LFYGRSTVSDVVLVSPLVSIFLALIAVGTVKSVSFSLFSLATGGLQAAFFLSKSLHLRSSLRNALTLSFFLTPCPSASIPLATGSDHFSIFLSSQGSRDIMLSPSYACMISPQIYCILSYGDLSPESNRLCFAFFLCPPFRPNFEFELFACIREVANFLASPVVPALVTWRQFF